MGNDCQEEHGDVGSKESLIFTDSSIMKKRFFCLLLQSMICAGLCAQVDLRNHAYSIVQDANTEIICTSPTDAVRKERKVIQILEEKGKKEAAFVCSCNKFTTLRKFTGEVQDSQGKIIRKIKKSELTTSEYSSELASDAYLYYFDYTPPQYPITIIYEWEVKYDDGLITYPVFLPQETYNQSVMQASYRIQTPADSPCLYRSLYMDAKVNQQKTSEGAWLTEVTVKLLPAIQKEPFSPSAYDLLPRILFVPDYFSWEGTQGNMKDWQSYGKWQYQLLQGRDELPPALKEELHKLTAACNSPLEKVAAIYQYLGNKTRYVSIQLGIGGLQPIPAANVHRTGFGDCKGLSNYMRAMLAEVGVPSYYTVISTDHEKLLPDFASANQMNHVILQVPLSEDTLWLECTNPEIPLGYVHNSIAGHDALLIREDGGHLYQLPAYPDSLNTQFNRVSVALSAEGEAQIKVKQSSSLSQYEDVVSLKNMKPTEQIDRLRFNINLSQADVRDVQIEEFKNKVPRLDVSYNIQTKQYGNRTGKRLFIPANIFHQSFPTINEKEERSQDIKIRYGYQDTDSINLRLPEGYEIESLPRITELKNDFGRFHFSIQCQGRDICIVQSLLLHRGTYSPKLYSEFALFMKEVANQYHSKIILRKSDEL